MKLLEVLLELRVVHLQKLLRFNSLELEAKVGIEPSPEFSTIEIVWRGEAESSKIYEFKKIQNSKN